MSAQQTQQTQQQSSSQPPARDPRRQQTSLARRSQSNLAPSVMMDSFDLFNMNPLSMFRRMQDEISRVFTQNNLAGQASSGDGLSLAAWAPPVEVAYRDGNLVVSAELPGLSEDDVDVQIVDDILVISGEKEVAEEEDRGDVRRTEIRYGQFYRAIPLPDGVKTQEARAQFQNGVLEITIPLEQANVRQIPVQADTSSQSSSSVQSSGQQDASKSPSTSSQKEKAA
ncbi:MAG TPA: Hsp20/alpha crystallin family protein [Candidatus Angelobacter sp.]|nr:Hsp20/alpha crystallin family protein [Candidatus Angelobacter sp.]